MSNGSKGNQRERIKCHVWAHLNNFSFKREILKKKKKVRKISQLIKLTNYDKKNNTFMLVNY